MHNKRESAIHGQESEVPLKVVYLLLHFPWFTETFVAAEIEAIRAQNVDVQIISLLSPRSTIIQPLSQRLLKYTLYAPGLMNFRLWWAQVHFAFKSFRLYLHLLETLLRQPYPKQPLRLCLKRVIVFLKAVAVAHYLEGTGVQLLHSHFAWLSGAASWVCARLLGIPFTITVHAYDIFLKNDLIRLVSREAARVIAISKFNQTRIAELGTCDPRLIAVIHCGVKLGTSPETRAKQITPTVAGRLSILSVGNLVPKKGHGTLVSACLLLKNRGLNFTCDIIGQGSEELSLRHQIESQDLQLHVKLLGPRSLPEIMDTYQYHDLFVLASTVTSDGDRDGIPVVLMEAGKESLPTISTTCSGIPELVHHGHTGLLVPPDDPTALADAIALLAADPSMRARLGRNARTLIAASFNIDHSAVKLGDVFRDTCRESGQGLRSSSQTCETCPVNIHAA